MPACAGMRYKRKRVESREINLNTSGLGGNLDFRCILFVFTCLRGYILRENAGIFAGNYLNTSGLALIDEFRCILLVFSCLRGNTLRGKAGRIAGN